jgi:hypothetical protein
MGHGIEIGVRACWGDELGHRRRRGQWTTHGDVGYDFPPQTTTWCAGVRVPIRPGITRTARICGSVSSPGSCWPAYMHALFFSTILQCTISWITASCLLNYYHGSRWYVVYVFSLKQSRVQEHARRRDEMARAWDPRSVPLPHDFFSFSFWDLLPSFHILP